MKKIGKRDLDEIEKKLRPGQKLVEVKLTVRWVTGLPLEAAVEDLTAYTDKFNPSMRIDGYVDASVIAPR